MTDASHMMDRSIARCRLVLSLSALVAIYLDPTEPAGGAMFTLAPYTLAALLAHFLYSTLVYAAVRRGGRTSEQVANAAIWGDVAFAAVIASVTEGTSSPFHVFFAFPLITAGFRFGLRRTLVVTAASVGLYLSLILLGQHDEDLNLRIMRPVYLAILGYLVGYMGERRLDLEADVRALERTAQRTTIARALHDGSCQALAGVNLRLQTCRELLRHGRTADTLAQLTDLQAGVTREYDELRRYVHSLTEVTDTAAAPGADDATRFAIRVEFTGSGERTDHVLQILREAVANVRRHARALTASVACRPVDDAVVITVDDDGVGFPEAAGVPWSIASRVGELGGVARLAREAGPGAHLAITVPAEASS
jgi:signal transduction histidine kinase